MWTVVSDSRATKSEGLSLSIFLARHCIPLELDDHPVHDRRGDDVLPEPLLLQQL
jgi:hypothetical protein